jgi:hypothetical protein
VTEESSDVFKRSDGMWWKWDGHKWNGPFENEEEARKTT